jgi:hypothetical protein
MNANAGGLPGVFKSISRIFPYLVFFKDIFQEKSKVVKN